MGHREEYGSEVERGVSEGGHLGGGVVGSKIQKELEEGQLS